MTNLQVDNEINEADAADISLPGNFELAQISIQNRKILNFKKYSTKQNLRYKGKKREISDHDPPQPQRAMKPNLEPKRRLQVASRIELCEVLSRGSRASAKAPIKQFEASFAPRVLPFLDQRGATSPVRPQKKKEHKI